MKIVVALVVIAAAVVGGVLLFGDDGTTATTNPGGGGTEVAAETPDLTFNASKPVVVTVTAAQRPKTLAAGAQAASKRAVAVLDTVYTEAFLDPSSWDGGSYDDAWTQFTDEAGARAEAQADSLTAGSAAGDTYARIEPLKATVCPRVLVDETGKPLSVVAQVYFTAEGMHDDGTSTLFKSTGQFFLEPGGNTWRVVAFDVRRADKERKAPPSPSTSEGSSPSESPS